jgi:very-short-patch-repair endonuclease
MWCDKGHNSKMRKALHMRPNKEEIKVLKILQRLYPNWFRYTGDLRHPVKGKHPDFVCEEKKLIIEYFGDHWHPDSKEERQRKVFFKKHGWRTLVIWGHEMKDQSAVEKKIVKFTENKLHSNPF